MKTLVLEPMPNLFWQIIDENKWQQNFTTNENADAEILIIRTKSIIDKAFFNNYSSLKMIIRAGSGFDNIDVREAVKRGIVVCNTPDANALAAAEHTLSFILAMIKNHQPAKKDILDLNWKSKLTPTLELSNLRALIVGVGRVGTLVSHMLQQLGAHVRGVDPYLQRSDWKQKSINPTDYVSGLKWCNLVSYHCPLFNETENYFNANSLKCITNPIWLINTARGGIVTESAVEQGLNTNKILGFAADVFPNEPWKLKQYGQFENVYLTPHIGANTVKAKLRISEETLRVWKAFVFGGKIMNKVDLRFCS